MKIPIITSVLLSLSLLSTMRGFSQSDSCKQKDELNKFGQDKLDNFRQHELNTLGR